MQHMAHIFVSLSLNICIFPYIPKSSEYSGDLEVHKVSLALRTMGEASLKNSLRNIVVLCLPG